MRQRTARPPTLPDIPMSASSAAALEVMVNAALAGHDLSPFEPISSGGYLARCRRCHKTVWIDDKGLIYSLLPDHCPL